MKKLKKKTTRIRRERLSSEELAAYELISKDPKYAAAAKVLKAGIIKLHKVYMAMGKKGTEIVKLAWNADR